MNESNNLIHMLSVMVEMSYSFSCTSRLGSGSTTPPQSPGNSQISVLVVFNPHSHLDSHRGLQEKAVLSFPTPCKVESDVKQMDFEVHTPSWQGPDFCIQEVSYHSALVHSEPQASGCGCLHSLLHPSQEPKAFHHKAIECFLSCTGRRYLL